MKPQRTIAFLLLLFISANLFGQSGVEFKVKILPGNTSFQVLARPNFDANPASIAGAQVTLRVPLGGFEIGNVTNHIGDWSSSPSFEDAASGFEYFFLVPAGPITGLNMEDNVEIPLFTFDNNGVCTGPMELFDNDNDPLANSTSVNFVNSISVLGGGLFGEAYLGNYNAISADCGVSNVCPDGVNTIDVIDIIINDPSACGLADGSLEIVAVASGEADFGPLQYGIEDSNGLIWQTNDPLFPNKAAGETFQLYVRHIGGFCQFKIGDFTLNAPLAAVVTAINDTPADCGMSNGTITITAVPNAGGQLQYGAGSPPVYQDSPTITGLPGGIHPLWVRDIVANCESQVASWLLEDCVNVPCSNLELEDMSNGRYQVSLTAGETINAPNDVTQTMRIMLKVPTGGFSVGNLISQVTNVDFTIGTITTAPTASPDYDYVAVELNSPNTQDIPYFAATKIPLFTFDNVGTCPGDSIFLVEMDDPFLISGGDVDHEIAVSGLMLNDCITNAGVECAVVPSNCEVTYEIDRLPTGEFRISVMTDNATLSGAQAITSGMLVTLKVPTGGFQFSNLSSLINSSFTSSLIVTAPAEDPGFDYYSISQQGSTAFNNSPDYNAGTYVPFLTFENVGPCVAGEILLVDNDDPTALAVAAGNNVNIGQVITILGVGPTIPACLSSNASVECQGDPCASLTPGFQVDLACVGANIDFTNTTTSNETIDSWEWTFGDGMSSDIESPSHTFSNSGNFEVSLTVTTVGGCEATFSEFVTVFPSPGAPTETEFTDCGSGVEITVPAAASIVWTPEDGLTPNPPTDQATVTAHPTATTVYNVTLTNADGCATSTDITVVVDVKPDWKDATPRPISDCGLQDGEIAVTATDINGGVVEYALDANGPWTTDTVFMNLAAGDYNVFARNADTGCPIASPLNPLTIVEPSPFSIDDVEIMHPTGCNPDGSVTVTVSGGDAPIQYTLVGVAGPQDSNVFANLMEGDYTLEVTNANGSCLQTQDITLTGTGNGLTMVQSDFASTVCVDATGSVSLSVSEDIQNVDITGGAFTNLAIDGPTVSFDVDPVMGANTYAVEFTGTSGCRLTENVNITGTAAPTASFMNSPSLCTGGDITLNFTGTANAGSSYQWSLGDGTLGFDDGNGNAIVSFATSGSKTITLTVNDGGCTDEATVNLQIVEFDPGLSLDINQPSCGLGTDGTITVNLTGAGNYDYDWTGTGTTDGSPTQSDLGDGTYQVIVTDTDSNCSIETSAILVSPTGINISTSSSGATDCTGNATNGSVSVDVNGGNNNFTYEIFEVGGSGTAIETMSVADAEFTFNSLGAGAYRVVVTDASGCTDEETVAVQSMSGGVTTTTAFTNADCSGQNGSVSVEITTGEAPYTFQYFNNNDENDGTVTGTTLDIDGVSSGTAVVIITDASGCVDVASFVIAEEAAPWLADVTFDVTEPSCSSNNGTVELFGLPTDVFPSWSHDATTIGTMADNVPTGSLDITLIDQNLCQETISLSIGSSNGPDIEVTQVNSASCGNPDGGFVFQVNSGNAFTYEIIGTGVITGQGNPGEPIAINDIEADNWVIQVVDLIDQSCDNVELVEVGGAFGVGANTFTTLPSECGVTDAVIAIDVDFPGMLNITSDQGTVPAQFTNIVTITDLYEGDVTITFEDPASGCTETLVVELGDQPDTQIDIATIDLTHLICPTDNGAIVPSNGAVLRVLDTNEDFITETPWMDAPAGTYLLELSNGQCRDTQEVIVNGPAPWQVAPTIVDESCSGQDGSIDLLVTGGTPDYGYAWSNNVSITSSASGLSAGSYSVTITDLEGCTFVYDEDLDNSLVGCDNPCEDLIFFTDTIFVNLEGAATKICLPTELTIQEFETFDLNLDGSAFNASIDECGEKATFYAYSSLLVYDPPPFRLDEWINPESSLPVLNFNSIDELVDRMNEADPTGNWVNDEDQMIIVGGNPNSTYGSLVINHVASNSTLSLQPNTIIVFNPSITVNDDRTHILIAADPFNGDCADTLYINLLTDAIPSPDTIYVEVEVGAMQDTCLDISELNGTLESLDNDCISFTNNAQWIATGSECIQVQGLDIGSDEFCMVLCDDNGLCDTTYVIVEVIDGSTDIRVAQAISPNRDGINDGFRITNIEDHPNNNLMIFNRWGNRVYKKKGYDNDDPWKAEFNNRILPDGTYFYLLEVEVDGVMETKKGWVQVRR